MLVSSQIIHYMTIEVQSIVHFFIIRTRLAGTRLLQHRYGNDSN